MTTFIVQRRADGQIVHAYSADAAVEWPEYQFAEFNHIPQMAAPDTTPSRRVSKLEFVARLGADYVPILAAAKSSVEIEAFVKMIDWATPEQDGTAIDLDDPRVAYGFGMLEQGGLIAAGRAAEILA